MVVMLVMVVQDRTGQNWRLNSTFQITCDWQLSQFLWCLYFRDFIVCFFDIPPLLLKSAFFSELQNVFVAVWLPYFGQRFPYTQVADDIQQLLLTNHRALDQLLSTRLEYFGFQTRNQDTPNVQKPKKDWCTEPTDPDQDSSTSNICFPKSVEMIIYFL